MVESTIGQMFDRHNLSGDIGLEIEVEGRRLPTFTYEPNALPDQPNSPVYLSQYWTTTRDGSLRGREAWEYIFAQPLPFTEVSNALEDMRKRFEQNSATVDNTMRAGVHVHINVNSLNVRQVFTFATAYYLLEEILTANAGFGRQGNHHALRLKDAYNVVTRLTTALSIGHLRELNTNDVRYAALNWNSLFNHGSLEFRQKGTNTCSFDDIYEWVSVLWSIKENAIANFATPLDVVAAFSGQGGDHLIRTLLPDFVLADKYVFGIEGWQVSIREHSRIVQDFAFIYQTIEEWEEVFGRVEDTPRPRNRRSNRFFEPQAMPVDFNWNTVQWERDSIPPTAEELPEENNSELEEDGDF